MTQMRFAPWPDGLDSSPSFFAALSTVLGL
jgi:hypothetical protein